MSIASNQTGAANAGTTTRSTLRKSVQKFTSIFAIILVAIGIFWFSVSGNGGGAGGGVTNFDKEPRFLGFLWKTGDAPPYTKDGRPNYWATFAGSEWNDSFWALNRGPMVPDTLVHKLDPQMQGCLEPANVQTLTAGTVTFTVCQSGPNGLPYFDATSELRALAKAMEDCGGNCDWVPGRLTSTGLSPDPGTRLINEGHGSWLAFNTGRGDNGWGKCYVYEARPGGLGDELVTMSYMDMAGNWKPYHHSIELPPGGYIEAQAFKMENNGPFPVPVSIASQRAPRHMHGNLEGRPFVCLRAL